MLRISKNRISLENIPLNEAAEVNVTSDATTDIGAAMSNNVNITGTTTITSFGTSAAGVTRKGRFAGALTLTHNATSLILPGVANITTATNDRFEALSLGSGNWIVTKYQKADGTSIVAGGGTKSGNIPVQIIKLGALNLNQNGTNYAMGLGEGETGTGSLANIRIQAKCTISKLRAHGNAAIPASNSLIVTLQKGGADTALTCTIAAAGTDAEDITNEVDLLPGDLIRLKLVSSATMTSTIDFTFTAVLTQTGSAVDEGSSLLYSFSGGSLNYVGEAVGSGTLDDVEVPMPACRVQAADGRDSTTAVSIGGVSKNGTSLQNYLFPSSFAGVEFTAGDYFAGINVGDASPPSFLPIAVDQGTQYDPCVMLFGVLSLAQGVTEWGCGLGSNAGITTESEVQIVIPACTLRNMRGLSSTAVASGTTTAEVFKNGVGTGLIVTWGTSSRYAEDVTNSAVFAAGDKMSLKVIAGGAVGSRDYTVSIESYYT